MYHPIRQRTVNAFTFDAATGVPSDRRVLARFEGETEQPDGGAIDSEGAIGRRSMADASCVCHPRTSSSHPIRCLMCPTMSVLGGADLKTLYVTIARQRRDDAELARLPQSGGIFAMRVDVPGLPEPAFVG
jgi:sugar lactone lactonase YvrE